MRRGKITKKSIIIIFIVAFFTVFSFLFDQLVIRTEDSMRNLNINFCKQKWGMYCRRVYFEFEVFLHFALSFLCQYSTRARIRNSHFHRLQYKEPLVWRNHTSSQYSSISRLCLSIGVLVVPPNTFHPPPLPAAPPAWTTGRATAEWEAVTATTPH